MYKAHQPRSTFWSSDVQKVYAVAARSTFPSQNVQSTPTSDHFCKLRCWKVYAVVVQGNFQVKMLKTPHARTTFDAPYAAFLWQVRGNCAPCQKWAKREGFVAVSATTRIRTTTTTATTIRYTTQRSTPLHYKTPHYTTLHPTTLRCTTLHFTTLHCTNYKTTTTSTARTK